MNPSYTFRPRARLDLTEQFSYLADRATAEVAERYFAAVDQTCARLAKQPRSGTTYDSGVARLEGMRRVPVSGFTAYLLFYVSRAGGIDVVRVLHGAQDIEHLFAEQEG
jgi:toxin ParE1/3/4